MHKKVWDFFLLFSKSSEVGNLPSLTVPAKTWVFVWERYIATDLTQFLSLQLCTNSKEKSEINIYYTLAILNLLNVFSKLCFPISVEI